MARVIFVRRSEARDARRWLDADASANGILITVEGDGADPSPEDEVAFLGFRRAAAQDLANSAGLTAYEIFKGAKSDLAALRAWMRPPNPVVVVPAQARGSYSQMLLDGALTHGYVIAERAIEEADAVAADEDDRARFVPFILAAIESLGAIRHGALAGVGLEAFFRPITQVEFAPRGATYSYADRTGTRRESGWHLKAPREIRGERNPALKPRLYFHTLPDASGTAVVLLYFGPHPQNGRQYTVSVAWDP